MGRKKKDFDAEFEKDFQMLDDEGNLVEEEAPAPTGRLYLSSHPPAVTQNPFVISQPLAHMLPFNLQNLKPRRRKKRRTKRERTKRQLRSTLMMI